MQVDVGANNVDVTTPPGVVGWGVWAYDHPGAVILKAGVVGDQTGGDGDHPAARVGDPSGGGEYAAPGDMGIGCLRGKEAQVKGAKKITMYEKETNGPCVSSMAACMRVGYT